MYWVAPGRNWKNLILLATSYIFYGWLIPWHVGVIFMATLLDYFLALGMARWKTRAGLLMWIGIALNLGLLSFVKYCFSFNASLASLLDQVGLGGDLFLARIILPL